jgi:hypothetical protein
MDPECLDALAAALAEAGSYDEAAKLAHKAEELATDAELKKAYSERAKKYEGKEPFRSPPPAAE